MSETTSISIDLETAALVEEIKGMTRLSKSEIARQSFAMFKKAIVEGRASIPITIPANQPQVQS